MRILKKISNCSFLLLQFDEIEFSEIVRTNIALARYTHPTPVQVNILDLTTPSII